MYDKVALYKPPFPDRSLPYVHRQPPLLKFASTRRVDPKLTYQGAKTSDSPAIVEYQRMNRKLMVLTGALSEKLSSEEMEEFRDELDMMASEMA